MRHYCIVMFHYLFVCTLDWSANSLNLYLLLRLAFRSIIISLILLDGWILEVYSTSSPHYLLQKKVYFNSTPEIVFFKNGSHPFFSIHLETRAIIFYHRGIFQLSTNVDRYQCAYLQRNAEQEAFGDTG